MELAHPSGVAGLYVEPRSVLRTDDGVAVIGHPAYLRGPAGETAGVPAGMRAVGVQWESATLAMRTVLVADRFDEVGAVTGGMGSDGLWIAAVDTEDGDWSASALTPARLLVGRSNGESPWESLPVPPGATVDRFEYTDVVAGAGGHGIGAILRSKGTAGTAGLFLRGQDGWSYLGLSDGAPEKIAVTGAGGSEVVVGLAEHWRGENTVEVLRVSDGRVAQHVASIPRPPGGIYTLRMAASDDGVILSWVQEGSSPAAGLELHRRVLGPGGGSDAGWSVVRLPTLNVGYLVDGVVTRGTMLWFVGIPSDGDRVGVRVLGERLDGSALVDFGDLPASFKGPFRAVLEEGATVLLVGPATPRGPSLMPVELSVVRVRLAGAGCGQWVPGLE
ncbi:MAG TPA: hypothetical protein VLH75_14420 [Longimicrobiales bacterium]|nr:hypothetical protein [Longimicrobiales bacterium]